MVPKLVPKNSELRFSFNCNDDDETFEMLDKSCTHYPIDNMKYMDKECDQEHEQD